MKTELGTGNPLAAWKRRRRNRTRLRLIEADWPGLGETCEKIADFVHQAVKPSDMAEVAIELILERAFEAYLGVLNEPSHTDHERLVAFITSALVLVREETVTGGRDEDLLQRFVRPEFWWIFRPEVPDETRGLERYENPQDVDLPVVEEIP